MASRITTRAVIKLISAHKLSFRLSPLLSICMVMTSRYKPEEIVAKLRQVDVLASQGQPMADAIRQVGE